MIDSKGTFSFTPATSLCSSHNLLCVMKIGKRLLFFLSCSCLLVSSFWSVCRYGAGNSHCKTTRGGLGNVDIFAVHSNKYYTNVRREIAGNVVDIPSTTSLWAASLGDMRDEADQDVLLSLSVKSVEIFESAAGTVKGKRTMVSRTHSLLVLCFLGNIS